MNNILVVKFGGSCLPDSNNIRAAAEKVAKEVANKKKVVVVVSALSGMTDQLLSLAQDSTSKRVSKEELDDIAAMGERIAVRLMSAALNAQGLKAVGVDPESELWPIMTDSSFGNAQIRFEATRKKVRENLVPLLEKGFTPVVSGFLGLSPDGKVTTLGRGGSDITAVVLGNCLDADEVVFVKDVEGVLSADPKKVVSPQKIDSLMIEEAYSLASAGAKVIQPKALMYKKQSMVLRVVGFDAPNLSGGTVITGELKLGLNAELYEGPLSMVTLIATNSSLSKVVQTLTEATSAGAEVLGLTISPSSILLYVRNPKDLVQRLHTMMRSDGIAKAIHSVDGLAMITVSGYGLEDVPGILEATVQPLAREDINLYGVFTISSSIRVFVPWGEREKALSAVKYVLERFRKEGDWNGIGQSPQT
ncbi:MAG: aspartate kinase [Candidatus Bathyarchaeia archaeon]